ncbi:MAG: Radical SAM domain protein [Candidatus Moranbacteria bacterium GW2011_GWF2_37_7]|nr:MAG: Radical SAM domain protein [Candidatus Moranbacteria bacterium GW2011_GWF2_37_7]
MNSYRWIEITTLIIPGKNDSEKELTKIAEFIASIDKNIPWHVSRFFPMYQMLEVIPTPEKTPQAVNDLAKPPIIGHNLPIQILDFIKHNLFLTLVQQIKIQINRVTAQVVK